MSSAEGSGHYLCRVVVCDLCGRSPDTDPDEVPLTWATSVENGEQRVYCDGCARDHLRSIEAKLDSEWW